MFILALDTSMAACSACVYDADRGTVLAANLALMEKGQAEALAPMVGLTMREAGLAFKSLSRIAVTTGPGTFTGVRIGLAFARGLGVSLKIPVIGINSLQAIAANEKSGSLPIIVASDARGGDVYVATFDAAWGMLTPPSIASSAALQDVLPANPCLVLGTGAALVVVDRQHIRSASGDVPVAANFVSLAATLEAADHLPEPLYLRPPDVKLSLTCHVVGETAASLLSGIHGECFDHPWSEAAFAGLLAGNGTVAVLASSQQVPAGFVLFRKVADEAEILTICTRPPFRQKGVAKALMHQLQQTLLADGVKSLFIEVAASNRPALALYSANGFEISGHRRNYYERDGGRREDAHIMRKGL